MSNLGLIVEIVEIVVIVLQQEMVHIHGETHLTILSATIIRTIFCAE